MVTDDMVEKACRANIHPDSDPSDTERRKMRAALEDALSAAEPVAWRIVGKFDSGSTTWKVVQHEHQAHEEAKSWEKMCAVEVHPLYAAPPAPSVAVKALEWSPWPENDQTKNGQSGRRIMRRADGAGVTYSLERVEPQSEWFYIPPGQVAGDWYVMEFWNEVAGPFKTDLEALEWCRQDHETRIRSALSAQVQDVAGWQLVPIKPTKAMAYAAACEHYGKKRVDQTGIEGISMTVNGIDYNFPTAFRKFWKGALAAAPVKQEG